MGNIVMYIKAVMYDLLMECIDAQWVVRGTLANAKVRDGFIHLARRSSEATLMTLRFSVDPEQPTGGARVKLTEVSVTVDPNDRVLVDMVQTLVRDIKARVKKLNDDEWSPF